MAGESARELARRQREKAERLARSAELYERGAEGEQRTAAVLAQLPEGSWTVFHDLRWPGRRYANVDHVVVGPPGVFVIDSKNWSGTISVRDNVLRQNGRARETAVSGAAEAAIAVGQLCRSVSINQVVPVLCFVRDEQVTGWSRDVVVCSTANLTTYLLSRPEVLTPAQVGMVSLELDAAFRSATSAVPSPVRRAARSQGASPMTRSRHTPPARNRASRRRVSRRGDVLRLLLVLVVALVLMTRPEIVIAVTSWFGALLAGLMVSSP